MNKVTIWIMPETHWDREWVMTLGQYQVRLVNLTDRLLEILKANPAYRFYFDGQAIVFDDYLEICPEKRPAIEAAFKSGQLTAGPFYVLADQFIPNGESFIRNLILGMRTIRELGTEPLPIGYVPDSFGVGASLPMILNGFGIRFAMFGRGFSGWNETITHPEFWWEGPDGSRVLAANHGYGAGCFLLLNNIWKNIFRQRPTPQQALEQTLAAAKEHLPRAATANLYFAVGVDHMEPNPDLAHLVQYINAHQDQYELIIASPMEYFQAIEKAQPELGTYRGEMRGSDANLMDLVGTLSSRVGLKQANHRCEVLLQRLLEPLCVVTEAAGGMAYPTGHLGKLWKLLVANHPHDSICGCSIDQVHRDMESRYQAIEATGTYLLKDTLHSLLEQIDTHGDDGKRRGAEKDDVALTVINTLANKRSGPVKSFVRVPKRFERDGYSLIDSEGRKVSSRITRVALKDQDLESVYMTNDQLRTVRSKNASSERADDEVFTVLEVDFIAEDVPGIGYKTWWLRGAPPVETVQTSAVRNVDGAMENEFLKVNFQPNGTMDLFDKRTGHAFRELGFFVDREDAGGGYDHHSLPQVQEVTSLDCRVKVELVEVLPYRVTRSIAIPWSLPIGIEEGKRSAKSVAYPITIRATLHAGQPRLDLTIAIDNTAKDHALRMAFDTGITCDHVSAGDNFLVIDRGVSSGVGEWRDQPMQDFVDVSDGIQGLCLMTRGLYAYEAFSEKRATQLQVTLLRAVGELGFPAGANHPAPEGQMMGPQLFEISLMPHWGDWQKGDCVAESRNYTTPLLTEADLPHSGKLPHTGSMMNLNFSGNPAAVMTCLKKAEGGNGAILRLWNPGQKQTCKITNHLSHGKLLRTNLEEVVLDAVEGDEITMPGRGLLTLQIGK